MPTTQVLAALKKVVSGLSPVLYHYTDISRAGTILFDDRFKLGTSVGTEVEEDLRDKKQKFFYLSTTRHKLGGFHKNTAHGVLFVLDGKKLGEKYSGDPVDYWGESFRKVDPAKFEAEDRVWSKDPYIEPATKYITEIHAINPNFDQDRDKRWVRKLLIEAKTKGIPIFVYTDRVAFRALDKRKALPLSDLDLKTEPEDGGQYHSRKRKNPLSGWLELYYNDKKEKLSKEGNRKLDYVSHRDGWVNLKNGIHNEKTDPDIITSITDILKKEKWSKLRQFYDHLVEKWADRKESLTEE